MIAFIATRSELLIVTLAAVELIGFTAEGLVDQRCFAHRAEEALLVPMSLLVGEIFGVGADLAAAFFAVVRKAILVAFNTVGMLIFENVARAGEIALAVRAREVILTHVGWRRMRCVTRTDSRLDVQRPTVIPVTITVDNLQREIFSTERGQERLTASCSSSIARNCSESSRGGEGSECGNN